ncbi:MAG: adenylate/guanylate cyclase domain-containing protein [Aquisalimonadaceae bacterium]
MPAALRDQALPLLLGLLLTATALWIQRVDTGPIAGIVERLDAGAYDLRLQLSLIDRPPPEQPIVIVDVDEYSLAAEGRWPWPRERIATLLDQLWDAGAAVVAFDMVFAEPQQNVALQIARTLAEDGAAESRVRDLLQLAPRFDGDARLAEALTRGDAVLGYVLHDDPGVTTGQLPPPLLRLTEEHPQPLVLGRRSSYSANMAGLQTAARHAGFFTTTPDRDGVVRRTPLILRHGDGVYPSLALETVRIFHLLQGIELESAPIGGIRGVEAVHLGSVRIPTDETGAVLVPYRGGRGSFPYISAVDVLHGAADQKLLDQAIVLLGTSAPGLYEMRATPVQGVFPGVEIHANLIAGLLDGSIPQEPKWAEGAGYMVILAAGIGLAALLPFLAPFWLIAAGASAVIAITACNYWLWAGHGLALPLAVPVVLVLALGVVNAAYGFFFEDRRRRLLQHRFGEYIPPELVEEMSRRPGHYGFDGENREMTVLFADIRGFTALSETLDAAALKELLNRFFTPMTRIIFEHRGTIDKYVGDMIMAFWGAPMENPEHRLHALQAALAMREELVHLRNAFQADGLPPIDIGIGLNSGMMNVGDMGSAYRRAYTVLGDAVNIAARLEGLTRFYQVNLVVSEYTRSGQETQFVFRDLDRVRVKGRREALTVYEPLGVPQGLSAEEQRLLVQYHDALAAYRGRRWAVAEAAFAALARAEPQRYVHQLYLQRIHTLRGNDPGPNWDGVDERLEK